MKWLRIFCSLCMLCFFFLFPKCIFAASEFTTKMEVSYTVNAQGITHVKHTIHLINNFSTMYATQYALEIGSPRIENIQAFDANNAPLQSSQTQTETKTSIALHFPTKVIGKDQERIFTVEYDHPDIAVIAGNILEVDIPKLVDSEKFASYTVSLFVPETFGQPAVVSPRTQDITQDQGKTVLVFHTAAERGINVMFGSVQIFHFQLKYHMTNPSISQGVSQIALPPDTSFQRMKYSSIDPKPERIERDDDGNWIATFTVGAQKELLIVADGYALIYLEPTVAVPTPAVQKDKRYVTQLPFWDVQDPEIQTLGKRLKTPKAIYDYVSKTLRYNYGRFAQTEQVRQGAAVALKDPTNAMCQEFTDVFIALCRAAGIPAREVNGYAYTSNQRMRPLHFVTDLLHAWPEYYDSDRGLWVPVDPTWANTTGGVDFFTKLDFHHVAFVLHGISSEKPYAAGMYKIFGKEEKDITMKVERISPEEEMVVQLRVLEDTSAKLGVSQKIFLEVENTTGFAWYDIPIAIEVPSSVHVGKGTEKRIQALLPYQKVRVPIVLERSPFGAGNGTVRFTVGDQTQTYEKHEGPQPTIFIYVAAGIIFCAACAGGILVFRKKQTSFVRGKSKGS